MTAVEAIQALKHRYFRACDSKDVAAFRQCFVHYGAFVGLGPIGSFDDADSAATAFEAAVRRTGPDGGFSGFDMHHGMHADIELVSDTEATGRWSLRLRHVDVQDGIEVLLAGEYADEYVVEDGAWKIRRADFSVLWSMRRPLGQDAVVTAPGLGAQAVV